MNRLLPMTMMCLLAVAGCQTGSSAKPMLLVPYEIEKLPPPLEEREKDNLPKGPEKAQGILKETCQCVPFDGVLMTERTTAKWRLRGAERDSLRKEIVVDRRSAKDKFDLCNNALGRMSKLTERSWWDVNKGLVGFIGGYVAAAATVIGLTFAVNEVSK